VPGELPPPGEVSVFSIAQFTRFTRGIKDALCQGCLCIEHRVCVKDFHQKNESKKSGPFFCTKNIFIKQIFERMLRCEGPCLLRFDGPEVGTKRGEDLAKRGKVAVGLAIDGR
jgi:hypothetical protein